ncbi:MAG: hypothetical protein U0836_26020 [Pirellulales bacterium]
MLRRLHSLSGLVPVGAYMVVHLLTNASVLNGTASFQQNVDRIHALGRALPVVEWVFIFIPLIFHAGYGFVRIYDSQANAAEYPYPKNIRYTLQRITGMVAFVYILFHVAQLHHLGFGQFNPEHATSSAAAAIGSRSGCRPSTWWACWLVCTTWPTAFGPQASLGVFGRARRRSGGPTTSAGGLASSSP